MTRSVSIFDADEKESAGGGGGFGGGAVTQLKDAAHVWHGEAAFADQEKSSNQIADHVMQKSVAAHGVNQFVGLALPLRLKDGADVVDFQSVFAALRIDSGKAGEVMLTFHQSRGLSHARFRERVRMVVNIARLEWRANCSTIDVVAVGFSGGGAARVEFGGHLFRGKNTD